ncbi:MAG: AMP-dependent synthetase/ligase [Promethearchaeota archaeon]
MKEEWYKHPTNLVDLFEDTIKKFPKRNCLGTKNSEGEYEWITYGELGARVDNLRAGLAQIGIGKDDAVGLIINNGVEWAIIAFATYGLNARLVPMYEKELEKVWRYIVEDGDVKVLFVVNDDVHEKVKGYKDEIDKLEKIYIIRSDAENSLKSLELLGSKNPIKSVKPHWSDIAGLIYTSGTTGDPKGVLLSHGNFTSNILAADVNFPDVSEKDITFSILPWAHSFGQTCEIYHNIHIGEACGLMDTTDTLTIDLPKVKPTILIAVPRIFNRIYQGIHFKMKQEGPKKEALFNNAKKAAATLREGGKVGFKDKLLMKIVFKKVRALFGGKLRYAVTGSAVMNPEIAQFFIDIGIPTFDGYGLTETSPVITSNCPTANKLGSVGKPIENVTVVIDKSLVGEDSEDGEILCFGPNVMQGYHKKPEKTKEVIVEDPKLGRGVRTGDRGKLDEEGFLFITGRFKEEFKLENGKYVHPASLEEDLKLNSFIANAMVYGDGKVHTVAILIPDFQVLPMFTKQAGITETDPQELVKNPKVQEFLSAQATNQLKGTYGGYEIPKKYLITAEEFTLENGMLTQTLKLKRRNVLQKYGEKLNALY